MKYAAPMAQLITPNGWSICLCYVLGACYSE